MKSMRPIQLSLTAFLGVSLCGILLLLTSVQAEDANPALSNPSQRSENSLQPDTTQPSMDSQGRTGHDSAVQTDAESPANSGDLKGLNDGAGSKPNPRLNISDHKKHLTGRLQKRAMSNAELPPALRDILKLKWSVAPAQTTHELRKITLEKVFKETVERNLDVRQAQAQIKMAEAEGKEMREGNLLTLLNPVSITLLKNAAESNVKAAQAHVMAVQQKALLDSAKFHADLVQAFLNKYVAFQAIEQGRSQLHAEQQRFISGETTSFDVTQTEMALMERYSKYLNADNLYHTASLALSNQLASPVEEILVPEDYLLQDDTVAAAPLNVIPDTFSLESALKACKDRPELKSLMLKKEALNGLIKTSFGTDKDKHEAELHQLELGIEKATQAAQSMTEKAFSDYRLAEQNLDLAKQRYVLASQFVHQLLVSHDAGFSSSKEVLDGQIESDKAKAGLISAQVAHNLSQIRLIYEIGALTPDILSKGINNQL